MKQTPLRKVSPKQAKELRTRRKLKAELIEKTGGVCPYCGQWPDWLGLDLSHEIPLARGGKTNEENCVIRCHHCHIPLRHGIKEV